VKAVKKNTAVVQVFVTLYRWRCNQLMVALLSAERGADHRQPQNMAVADWPVVGLAAPIGHIKSINNT
jgi:hypothetical protein